MLLYLDEGRQITMREWKPAEIIPPNVFWVDLLAPTKEQQNALEQFLGFSIPTREEMSEIEVSNRLYEEHGGIFATGTLLAKVDTDMPVTHAVTFIVANDRLVTLRYVDTTSFRRFSGALLKSPPRSLNAGELLLNLIEAIVNRQADILERVDRQIEDITHVIFRHREPGERDTGRQYQDILERIGRAGDITAKIHESLVTFNRVAGFIGSKPVFQNAEHEAHISLIRRDIAGLSDHGQHLNARVNFLLDATLGMITIQQNGVFKVLSVASLIFMPPTLVAGIYGMNFHQMPELSWHWGYQMSLLLMLLSGIIPYAYLRQRGWL